jgi:hypothetical protein
MESLPLSDLCIGCMLPCRAEPALWDNSKYLRQFRPEWLDSGETGKQGGRLNCLGDVQQAAPIGRACQMWELVS